MYTNKRTYLIQYVHAMDFQMYFESKVILTNAEEAHIAHIIEVGRVGHVCIGVFRIITVVPASIIIRLSCSYQS